MCSYARDVMNLCMESHVSSMREKAKLPLVSTCFLLFIILISYEPVQINIYMTILTSPVMDFYVTKTSLWYKTEAQFIWKT